MLKDGLKFVVLSNVTEMLLESDVYGVRGLSDILYFTFTASNKVDYIVGLAVTRRRYA